MSREWTEVPEYAASLERTLGANETSAFRAAIEQKAGAMRAEGRALRALAGSSGALTVCW